MARRNTKVYMLHAAGCIVVLLSPLMYIDRFSQLSIGRFLTMSLNPLALIVVFYLNFLWLTPKYYAKGKISAHILINVVIIVALDLMMHASLELSRLFMIGVEAKPPGPDAPHSPTRLMLFFFLLRDLFNMTVAAIVATTISLAMRWQKSEKARQAAEQERTKAELKNLRSQINPHFLLNTLNNIYALTTINTERAKKAIEQLGRLLRHILYDNEVPMTELSKEVAFIADYVNLMKLRLTPNVKVSMETNIKGNEGALVEPMLFISLVENAFKHGVSPTKQSYININIGADDQFIFCDIVNSNFPKTSKDRSGHGIGLKQVERRLQLSYNGRYEWKKGTSPDNKEYFSNIKLKR